MHKSEVYSLVDLKKSESLSRKQLPIQRIECNQPPESPHMPLSITTPKGKHYPDI